MLMAEEVKAADNIVISRLTADVWGEERVPCAALYTVCCTRRQQEDTEQQQKFFQKDSFYLVLQRNWKI